MYSRVTNIIVVGIIQNRGIKKEMVLLLLPYLYGFEQYDAIHF
jgi:hypothetical protein